MLVEVTQDDIREGVPGDCAHCPIALALKRLTGHIWWVNGIYAYRDQLYVNPWPLPIVARNFSDDFDVGEAVKPFNFEMPEPAEETNA